jgi:hypothetical protein
MHDDGCAAVVADNVIPTSNAPMTKPDAAVKELTNLL